MQVKTLLTKSRDRLRSSHNAFDVFLFEDDIFLFSNFKFRTTAFDFSFSISSLHFDQMNR